MRTPARPGARLGPRGSLRRCLGFGILLVVASGPPARAQIVAPAGRTLFNEGVLVRSFLRLDTFEGAGSGEDPTVLRSVNAVVWGARPHTSVGLVVPLVRAEATAPGTGREVSRTGTGDASVFARYDVLRRSVPGGYTRLAPELGVKLPTGGAFGTGSTDLVAGLVVSHVRDPDWWIGDVQLTFPGRGDGDLRAGDRRRFDIAYLRRVFPRRGMGIPMVLVVLELNGELADESTRGGARITGTGGDLVYLSPGVEYLLSRRWVLEASLPIPIYEDLGAARPVPRVSAILGVRWLF